MQSSRLYTPIHDEPTVGKEAATQILQVVFSIFENFQYSDVVARHEKTHALIFRADVGSFALHGADYLRMTPDGLAAEFRVMVRPLEICRMVRGRYAAIHPYRTDPKRGQAAAVRKPWMSSGLQR